MIEHPVISQDDAEDTNARRNVALDLLDAKETMTSPFPSPNSAPSSAMERKTRERPAFVFYRNWRDIFEELNDHQAKLLIMSIFRYVDEGLTPDDNTFENLGAFGRYGFRVISRQIALDSRKYAETCRRNAENGKKGGRPRK